MERMSTPTLKESLLEIVMYTHPTLHLDQKRQEQRPAAHRPQRKSCLDCPCNANEIKDKQKAQLGTMASVKLKGIVCLIRSVVCKDIPNTEIYDEFL